MCTNPCPTIEKNDPSTTLIFCFLKHGKQLEKNLYMSVMWSKAPKTMIHVWKLFWKEIEVFVHD